MQWLGVDAEDVTAGLPWELKAPKVGRTSQVSLLSENFRAGEKHAVM